MKDQSSDQLESADTILFFDGVCGLCSKSVDWLLARDSDKKILFAPLQGETAEKFLSREDRENLDTVIFLERGKVYRRSEAVFRAVQLLGPSWNLLVAILNFIPVQIRDIVYRAVAANRYPILGRAKPADFPRRQNGNASFLKNGLEKGLEGI